MPFKERRSLVAPEPNVLRRDLNTAQLTALRQLENFGWELKFVRRPIFQPAIPVIFDADRSHYAVLESDGSLNEAPAFPIRH